MVNIHNLNRWLKDSFGPPEIYLLLVLFVPTALLLCFGSLASEVLEGDTMRFDRAVLLGLRTVGDPADPIGPQWLESMFLDITSLGSITVLTFITASAVLYLLLAGKLRYASLVCVAAVGGSLLSSGLKSVFERPRPDFIAHIVDVSSTSFPSSHTLNSAVIYLTLGVLLARVEPRFRLRIFIMGLALFCTLSIGLSRMYLGVHYPTDVLAGWMLGIAWAVICLAIILWIEQHTKPDVM